MVDKNLFTRHIKPLMTSQNSLEANKMLSHTLAFTFRSPGLLTHEIRFLIFIMTDFHL